jgi:hypothetical protein
VGAIESIPLLNVDDSTSEDDDDVFRADSRLADVRGSSNVDDSFYLSDQGSILRNYFGRKVFGQIFILELHTDKRKYKKILIFFIL